MANDSSVLPSGGNLRRLRMNKRVTAEEFALRCGMPVKTYYDLESSDDLRMAISLSELNRICVGLGVSPSQLLEAGTESVKPAVDIAGVLQMIRKHCEEYGMTIEEFEDRAGWTIRQHLSSPERAFEEWNMDCLKDVCSMVGIDWRAVKLDAN
jgi:DNA-binding Xre family transcriptional regulator